jgi:hypothetical protein
MEYTAGVSESAYATDTTLAAASASRRDFAMMQPT